MEKAWQIKCGQPLLPTSPFVDQSVQVLPQESRNQMTTNKSDYIFSRDEETRKIAHGVTSLPIYSNVLNYKSGHPETCSSFPAPLSDPPSISQCDFQQLTNLKSSDGNSTSANPGFAVNFSSKNTSWPFPQHTGNRTLRHVADVHPVFPTSATMNVNEFGSHVLRDDLDRLAELITHASSGTDGSRPKVACTVDSSIANDRMHHGNGNRDFQKIPVGNENASLVSDKPSASLSGCPRVFCMGLSGALLLSNTGLLGIVCSCHGVNMSVSKFCEHSGISDVNPGHAVHMDSGDSIAQWRKIYLQKFGLRAPEDHRGWDWPDGFLSTAAVKLSSIVAAGRTRDSLSTESVCPGQLLNNVAVSNHHPSCKYVNEMSPGDRLVQDGYKQCNSSLAGLTGSHTSYLHSTADNRIGALSSEISNTIGKEGNVDQSGFPSSNLVCTSEDTIISAFQNLQNAVERRENDLKGSFVPWRGIFSFNTELKLGQPSRQSWSSSSTVLPAIQPQIGDLQKGLIMEKMIYNCNCMVNECTKQHSQCKTGSSNSSMIKEPCEPDLVKYATRVSSANGASRMETFKNEVSKRSEIEVSILPTATFCGDGVHHKESNKPSNDSDHFIPQSLHCQCHINKSSLAEFPDSGRDERARTLFTDNLNLQINKERTVVAGCGCKCLGRVTKSGFESYPKHLENPGLFTPKCHRTSHAMAWCRQCYSCHTSSMVPDIYDVSKGRRNASCHANGSDVGNFPHRVASLKIRDGVTESLWENPMGLPSLKSVLETNLSKNDAGVIPHIPDESLRVLESKSIAQSLKGDKADASSGLIKEQGVYTDKRQQMSCHCFRNPGAESSPVDVVASEGQRNQHHFTIGCNVWTPFLDGPSCQISGDTERIGDVTGTNKLEDLVTCAQIMALCPKDPDKCCQVSFRACPNEQPSLRLSRTDSEVTPWNICEECRKRGPCAFIGRCRCVGSNKSLNKGSHSEDVRSAGVFNQQAHIVGDVTLTRYSSRVGADCDSGGGVISVEKNGNQAAQVHQKHPFLGSRWRDVPPKAGTSGNMECLENPGNLMGEKGESGVQFKESAAKCSPKTYQEAELFRDGALSKVSSGCSAPDIPQASIEVNNIGFCAGDDDTGNANGHVIDQGSTIAKKSSSIGTVDSGSSEHLCATSKTKFSEEKPAKISPNLASYDLIVARKRRNSVRWKKLENLNHSRASYDEVSNNGEKCESQLTAGKRKRGLKWKMLGSTFSASKSSLLECATNTASQNNYMPKDIHALLGSDHAEFNLLGACNIEPSLKRGRSSASPVKPSSHKRDLNKRRNSGDWEYCSKKKIKGNDDFIGIPEFSAVKRLKVLKSPKAIKQCRWRRQNFRNAEKSLQYSSTRCLKAIPAGVINSQNQKAKPLVCGKYGILCSGELLIEQYKPPKIVPLGQVLKTAKRCTKHEKKCHMSDETSFHVASKCTEKSFHSQSARASMCSQISSCDETQENSFSGDESSSDYSPMLEKNAGARSKRNMGGRCRTSQSKPKYKRIPEIVRATDFNLPENLINGLSDELGSEKMELEVGKNKYPLGDIDGANARRYPEEPQHQSYAIDLKASCCVCGSSNKDKGNCLLECSHCLIRVHQACYGIPRAPKGHWNCRPCRTSTKNIACVLCGYGGGAMTQALHSHKIVEGLLNAWSLGTEYDAMSVVAPSEAINDSLEVESENKLQDKQDQLSSRKSMVHNTITASLLDSTIKQWVHVVCALWTPGTRCASVETVNAFDVSGVCPKANVVCSICKRPGGSCIQCRIEACSSQFHPWCAHLKGLLQSEVNGAINERVGFYGRCMLHAEYHCSQIQYDLLELDAEGHSGPTCARTKVYKGRKQDGVWYNALRSNGKGGCLVPQVQLDAWVHINRQKLGMKILTKPAFSDIEHDYKKEYARYKQAKGWKHLVVYKSGIHALGLYTSQFIRRGAMVVEYIGEIVGLRVADKRESEYQSGRGLQYKSACYFFRIDKEHIIDATCKGGIARFVNHSCMPNCVAKVITIKNEKKVVFFAERDIYPGEEITYDYHFNREDEGKRIPCLCNSNNCRRYLN